MLFPLRLLIRFSMNLFNMNCVCSCFWKDEVEDICVNFFYGGVKIHHLGFVCSVVDEGRSVRCSFFFLDLN